MASIHTTARFVKLHYTDAEFEPAGVPALLAYRGGDKFAGFVPISDEIPDNEDLSARSLELSVGQGNLCLRASDLFFCGVQRGVAGAGGLICMIHILRRNDVVFKEFGIPVLVGIRVIGGSLCAC